MEPDVAVTEVASGSSMTAAECVERVRGALAVLPNVDSARHELGSRDLAALTRDTLALLQMAETAAVSLVADAVQRGVISESTAAGAAQWVSRLSAGESLEALLPPGSGSGGAGPLVPLEPPEETDGLAAAEGGVEGAGSGRHVSDEGRLALPGVEPAVASRIAKVATACTERRNDVLTEAIADHRVGVAAARTALIEVEKVMPVLPGGTREKVFGHFLELPPGAGSRSIRELSQRVIATYADEDFLDDVNDRLDAVESVTWSELPNGMHKLIAELSPLHAAQVEHALDALSAPSPGNTCCDNVFHRHTGGEKTGESDDRSPQKRRADAFMLLFTRGAGVVDDDGAVSTSGEARIVVTIDHEVLVERLRGCGRTDAATSLTASQVRQLACDAEILPMVLGSRGEPLDVGRVERLVPPGMRAAVVQRDRCCTFPGCDRPPSWCQVHHIVPWSRGGPTSLENSALLCQRHHTIVHQQEYDATVMDAGVTWDLRPHSMRSHVQAA